MENSENIFTRRQYNAKQKKYIDRLELFENNRKTKKFHLELSYLKYYSYDMRKAIIRSIEEDIPSQLPQLNIETISYFRREFIHIFKTHPDHTKQLDPHMTFQSLWMLSRMPQDSYQDYQIVIKQFEQNLSKYLDSQFSEIQKYAIIAAGNNILGFQSDILKIVQKYPKQIWVLINHINAGNISCQYLYKYLGSSSLQNDEILLRAILELSNNFVDCVGKYINYYPQTITTLIAYIRQDESAILRTISMQIIGNILAQSQHIPLIKKQSLLQVLFSLLDKSTYNQDIIFDICWVLSNYISDNIFADEILQNDKYFMKILQMFLKETSTKILIELITILKNLVIYGNQKIVLQLLSNENIVQRFVQLFQKLDNNIIYEVLALIEEFFYKQKQQRQQGEQGCIFMDEKNSVISLIGVIIMRNNQLYNKITQFQNSQQNKISKKAQEILNKLQ